jgi:hypothetical protein
MRSGGIDDDCRSEGTQQSFGRRLGQAGVQRENGAAVFPGGLQRINEVLTGREIERY